MSLFFKVHRAEYYRRFTAVRSEGDWEGWLHFFLDGVATIADEAVASARDLFRLVAADRGIILERDGRSIAALRLFELLPRHPVVTVAARFNPLLEIREGLCEVKDTQNVADILVDPTGEKDSKDHWQTTAHSLLCGAILHVLYAKAEKTLAGVAAFVSDPGRT